MMKLAWHLIAQQRKFWVKIVKAIVSVYEDIEDNITWIIQHGTMKDTLFGYYYKQKFIF